MMRSYSENNLNLSIYCINIYKIACIIYIVFIIFSPPENNWISILFLLLTNTVLLYKCRDNIFLLIITIIITYSNYSIIYANYISPLNDSIFTRFISKGINELSLEILTVFNILFFLLFPIKIYPYSPDKNLFSNQHSCAPIIPIFIFIWVIISYFYGFSISDVIGERGSPKPVYEYTLCIFILGYYFFKSKKLKLTLDICILLYAAQNFIYGGRILGLQFLLCFYFFRLSHIFKRRTFLLSSIPIILLMQIIGVARGELLYGNFSIEQILDSLIKGGGALDTAYSAFHTSKIFVFMDKMIPYKIPYITAFFMSILLGWNSFQQYQLNITAHRYFTNYEGGIYPFHWYFYFNWIGVAISALILKPFINMVNGIGNKDQSGLKKCIGIYFVCSCFRWYLYSPTGFYRGSILLAILYMVFNYFSKIHSKGIISS